MRSWRSMTSVLAVSGAAVLFGAGCASQQDQVGDVGEDTTAEIAAGTGEQALTAALAQPDESATSGDEVTGEKTGESQQAWWGGWGRRGWGGWGGGWGGWGGWGGLGGWGGWGGFSPWLGGFGGWGGCGGGCW